MEENKKSSMTDDIMGSGSQKANEIESPVDLDYVLINEIGQFGRFQLRNFLLVAVPIIMSAFMSEYIFSAAAIPHRYLLESTLQFNYAQLTYFL